MKLLIGISIRVVWAMYLVISSIYCLLAYLPYTYFAFVKAPAYPWMPWIAAHHHTLFLGGLAVLAVLALWEKTGRITWWSWAALGLSGIANFAYPVLAKLQNDGSSFIFGLLFLLLLPISSALERLPSSVVPDNENPTPVGYAVPVAFAAVLAIMYNLGVQVAQIGVGKATPLTRWASLLTWTIAAHVTVALLLVSILNLTTSFCARFRRARFIRLLVLAALGAVVAFWGVVRLLSSALSFDGPLALTYAAALVISVAVFAGRLGLRCRSLIRVPVHPGRKISVLLFVVAATIAFFAPRVVQSEQDWNGILQQFLAITVWLFVAVSAQRLQTRNASASLVRFGVVGAVAVLVFAALRFSEIGWAKPLGNTDDEITQSVDEYSALDASFRTAHVLLGGGKTSTCDDRCRIFRQYTNIRQAPPVAGFDLVDDLRRSEGEHPNVFIWVIDSLRPDYLGAYNPKVNFSPNFDAFAEDSLALKNAYSQYSGTTLSVPAIWAGAEVLHTHYPQPFDKINSLLKLARVDGYQVMVSRDTVLGDLLPDTSEITNIEQGENLWMHQEMCQSVDALNEALDRRRADGRPILFFSQPMNIHQFAINNQPRLNSNWSTPGFNNRVSHEVNQVDGCFGKFVMSLKERKMYDNSIIIVTSDHGDALGEFGRSSHSLTIYPEIMRVPLLIHLPKAMKNRLVFDEEGTKMLTDLAPTLYYVLGHREIRQNPLFGRPLLVESRQEVDKYRREEWMLASDAVAVYGILGAGGRYFYAAYDSPARSYLYDLRADPQGTEDVLTPELKRKYDREIIDHLNKLADFYGYHPGLGKFFGGQ